MTKRRYRAVKQTQSVLIHLPTLNCFLETSFFQWNSLLWRPLGFSFIPVGGITFWLESRARGSRDHFLPPLLSHICSPRPERKNKKTAYGEGELTCLSDSLLCSRIISLQPTADWLCDIFTKSEFTADLNAKRTLRRRTTFYLCACLLLSNLKAVRILSPIHILPDPIDLFWWSPWQQKDELGGVVGGRTSPMRATQGYESGSGYSGMVKPPVHTERLVITKWKWVMYCIYPHVKDAALSPSWFDSLPRRSARSGGGKNILQFRVKLEKYPAAYWEMCSMSDAQNDTRPWPPLHNTVHSYIQI